MQGREREKGREREGGSKESDVTGSDWSESVPVYSEAVGQRVSTTRECGLPVCTLECSPIRLVSAPCLDDA